MDNLFELLLEKNKGMSYELDDEDNCKITDHISESGGHWTVVGLMCCLNYTQQIIGMRT